jgi:hypothetical protein
MSQREGLPVSSPGAGRCRSMKSSKVTTVTPMVAASWPHSRSNPTHGQGITRTRRNTAVHRNKESKISWRAAFSLSMAFLREYTYISIYYSARLLQTNDRFPGFLRSQVGTL